MKHRSWFHRHLPVLALGLVMVLVGLGGFLLLRRFLSEPPPHQRQVVQEIQLVRPPPPPPKPPPPPPPTPKVHIPTPRKAPVPTPNRPPANPRLGLDAKGGAGSDAFGLAARPGGRDIIGSEGSAFAWYAGLLKDQILNQLGNQPDAHTASYSVTVSVWLGDDGTIRRVAIARSSGNVRRDHSIEQTLLAIGRLSQPPPVGMPEPVTLRIVSHT